LPLLGRVLRKAKDQAPATRHEAKKQAKKQVDEKIRKGRRRKAGKLVLGDPPHNHKITPWGGKARGGACSDERF